MTTYTFPTITPTEVTIGRKANTRINRSPFSGAVQTTARGGERLTMRMVFRNLDGATRASLIAFLMKLNGQEHRFTCEDFSYRGYAGVGGGTPRVNGALQTGSSLIIDGCPLSTTGWLKAGDEFSVESRLRILTADVNTDGAGNATLNFRPANGVSPNDNALIIAGAPMQSGQPVGTWMLSSDYSDWTTPTGVTVSDFVVDCEEDVLT